MPDRIQFGSCNSQHYENEMWPAMKSRQPSAFVWVGDAVYADDFEWTPAAERNSFQDHIKRRVKEAAPEDLERLYQRLLRNYAYRTFIQADHETEAGPLVMGTFDDHDYGRNNGDRNYKYKRESAMLFMDFIAKSNKNVHASEFGTMEYRAASGKGLYGVKVLDFARQSRNAQVLSDQEAGLDPDAVQEWDPSLTLSNQSVAIFVLDCRSNKTPWPKRTFFAPSTSNGDFLGEEQWRWFEEALRRSTASVNIVVQGLQVHAEHMFDGNIAEEWSLFPRSQHRLYQSILKSNVSSPILVSGDVHMFELSRKDCRKVTEKNGRYNVDAQYRPLLEVTTSGLTHSWGTKSCARPKENFICTSPYYQRALRMAAHFAHLSGAWTELVDIASKDAQEGAKCGIQYSILQNFAEFEFDWQAQEVTLRAFGKVPKSLPLSSTTWNFTYLSALNDDNRVPVLMTAHYVEKFHNPVLEGFAESGDWVCINNRGPVSFAMKVYGIVGPGLIVVSALLFPLILPIVVTFGLLKLQARKRKQIQKVTHQS